MLNEYKITNIGAMKCLNVNGDNVTSLVDNQNLTVWENSGTDEQRWYIETIGNGVYIRSVIDYDYGLNVYRSGNPWNCDVYPVEGNETDAAVNIIQVGGYYRIQLTNYPDLYLTAASSDNGANVYWTNLIQGSPYQTWALNKTFDANSTGFGVVYTPNMNNKAYYGEFTDLMCCCCNIDGYYNPGVALDLRLYKGISYDVETRSIDFDKFPYTIFTHYIPSNNSQAFRKIRHEVSEKRPILLKVRIFSDTSERESNWVFAFCWNNNGDTLQDIHVYDADGAEDYSDYGCQYYLSNATGDVLVFEDFEITEMYLTAPKE